MKLAIAIALADLPTLMTVAEAATALRVDERTVRRWIAAGRLAAGRTTPVISHVTNGEGGKYAKGHGGGCGGRVLIPKPSIVALLAGEAS